MGRRGDFLKAASGMVLAAGGAWAVHHAHAGGSVLGSSEFPAAIFSSSIVDALSGKAVGADVNDPDANSLVHPQSQHGKP